MQIEDLEGRIASTEAALNTATADLEEKEELLSPMAQVGPLDDGRPQDSGLEPRLPDIIEKGPPRGANAQNEQIEQLEELVAELKTELQELQEAYAKNQGALQETKVSCYIQDYIIGPIKACGISCCKAYGMTVIWTKHS